MRCARKSPQGTLLQLFCSLETSSAKGLACSQEVARFARCIRGADHIPGRVTMDIPQVGWGHPAEKISRSLLTVTCSFQRDTGRYQALSSFPRVKQPSIIDSYRLSLTAPGLSPSQAHPVFLILCRRRTLQNQLPCRPQFACQIHPRDGSHADFRLFGADQAADDANSEGSLTAVSTHAPTQPASTPTGGARGCLHCAAPPATPSLRDVFFANDLSLQLLESS